MSVVRYVDRYSSLATEQEWEDAVNQETQRLVIPDDHVFARNRIGQVELPRPLIDGCIKALKDVHKPSLYTAARKFYESTSGTGPSHEEYSDSDARTFLAAAMPQVYASMIPVLKELRKRLGESWSPRTICDVGLGPGTSASAFIEVFGQRTIDIIRSNEAMKDLTRQITGVETSRIKSQYDVIMAPHVLGDVKGRPHDRDILVNDLWSRTADSGILILLERGNPQGYEHIVRARELILRASPSSEMSLDNASVEAHVIAPCPHDNKCPLHIRRHIPERRQWCHFKQRLQRPEFLQSVKRAKENTEVVSYIYVVLRKSKRPEGGDIANDAYSWPRMTMPPLKRHKHVLLDVCAPGGMERHTVPRSQGREEYYFARKSHWGDLLPFRGKSIQDGRVLKV